MYHRLGSCKLLSLIIKSISWVMILLFILLNSGVLFYLIFSLTKGRGWGLCRVFIATGLDLHPIGGWTVVNDVERVASHVSKVSRLFFYLNIIILHLRLGSIARHIVELVEDRRLCDNLSFRTIIVFILNKLFALMMMAAAAKSLEWVWKGLLLAVICHLSVRLPGHSGLPYNIFVLIFLDLELRLIVESWWWIWEAGGR